MEKFSPNPSGPGFFEFSLEQDRFDDVPNNSSSNFPIINCLSGNWANMNSLPTPQLFFDFITKRKAWSLVLLPLGQVSALVVYMSSNILQLTVGSLHCEFLEHWNAPKNVWRIWKNFSCHLMIIQDNCYFLNLLGFNT